MSTQPSTDFYVPAGSTARDSFDTVIEPGSREGWVHTGLLVLALDAGQRETWHADGVEAMVVPLNGSCEVTLAQAASGDVNESSGHDGEGKAGDSLAGAATETFTLRGRENVFASATDVLYVPVGATIAVSSTDGGRFAIATARATGSFPPALIKAEDIAVEERGGGNMTRYVRNFGTVGAFDECDSLIACEVITPGGNWSSYPAHKHDEQTETESELEEIYYYEIAPSPEGGPGFGFHQTTASDSQRPIDVLSEVRSGDVVLVPYGWHGPCAAAPGHDMYYLNVMAGPAQERAWNITDHPDQTWVRGTW